MNRFRIFFKDNGKYFRVEVLGNSEIPEHSDFGKWQFEDGEVCVYHLETGKMWFRTSN